MKIKEFFYFQKSDRQVLLVLLGMAVVFMSLTYFLDSDEMDKNGTYPTDSLSYQRQVDYPRYKKSYKNRQPYYAVAEKTEERFPFDPNTADSTQFLRLGLQPWQIRNIYKYRAHGGVYRKASDFARLYGLTLKQYKSLEPYIHISSDYRLASEYYEQESMDPSKYTEKDTVAYSHKIAKGEYVLLNVADTATLKKVPGIGSGFARAIIRYGERLGGYYTTEQLLEIHGFPEEALAYFQIGNVPLHKLNVNKLSLEQLHKHPYISFYQARAIVEYRRLHGPLTSMNQLSTTGLFPEESLIKLRHYIIY